MHSSPWLLPQAQTGAYGIKPYTIGNIRRSAPTTLNIKGFSTQKVPLALVSGTTIGAVFGSFTPKCGHLGTC